MPAQFSTPGYEPVAALLREQLVADPGYSAQVAAYVDGEKVLDLWGGPDLDGDSLIGVFSVSKGITAICLAVLHQRGLLELDETVAHYWPEFAASGKEQVTVRQLLSHQAGLPEVDGNLSRAEYLDDRLAAVTIAAQRPLWRPGLGWSYHAVTIGLLANELVRRITGGSVQEFYERELRAPRGIDAYLGLPEALEPRVRPVLMPIVTPPAIDPGQIIDLIARPLLSDHGLEFVANTREGRAIGTPAAGAVASARGIAALYAGVLGPVGGERILDDATIAIFGQVQSIGHDLASGQPGRFGVLFQKPFPERPFAGYRSIGHDGAAGSLGFADPDGRIAFGFVTNRPAPAGGDRRADALASVVRRVALGS